MRPLFCLAALSLLAAPLAAADPVTIKWSLKEGDTFYATTAQEVDQNIKVMGQAINQKMTTTTVAKFVVKSVKGDATTVEMTYTKVTIEGGPPGTAALTDRFKGAVLSAALGKGYDITKLEGYDKFLDKLSDGDDMMRQIFTAVMPESAVKLLFTQVFVAAPGDKASDKWTRTDKVPLAGLGDLTNKTTYTVEVFVNTKIGIADEPDNGTTTCAQLQWRFAFTRCWSIACGDAWRS